MTTEALPAGRRIEHMALRDLVPHPGNPKDHDLDVINASVARFGYIEPVVLDERTRRLISGHGRTETLLAMEQAGQQPPDGITIDPDSGAWLAPVVVGWSSRSDAEANAAVIALNRATELGGWVDESLLTMLDQLAEIDDGLDGVGFDTADIDELRDRLAQLDADSGDDDADRYGDGRGELLDIVDLSFGEPEHQTRHGEHWTIADDRNGITHHLFVVNPHKEWQAYVPQLQPGMVFAPYPDVWLTCSDVAQQAGFLLVQPLGFLAGHLLDKHHSAHPEDKITNHGRAAGAAEVDDSADTLSADITPGQS